MPKLNKTDFNKKYRFRESRNGLVSCVTCDTKTGEANEEGSAFCENEERFRRIKISEYWRGLGPGTSHNISSKRICDAYVSKPLPEGVEKPILPEKQIILLGSQGKDIYHADLNCPYVIEELRRAMTVTPETIKQENPLDYFKRPGVHIEDRLYQTVPGQTIGGQICEMPCCENKLPYQTWRIDDYRRKANIKPDGTEPEIWIRNGIVNHEKKVAMTPEEAEIIFDLEKFNSPKFKNVYSKIAAASDQLHDFCNRLGSRPLSEAVNPVWLDYSYSILKDSLENYDNNAIFWVCNERLFDIKKGLEKSIKDLKQIPEGLIPCIDKKRVFRNAQFRCRDCGDGTFTIYGVVKEVNDENPLYKGASHILEASAISYHGNNNHMWGIFGKGFNELASFHEE